MGAWTRWLARPTTHMCSQCYQSLGQSLQIPLFSLLYVHRRKDRRLLQEGTHGLWLYLPGLVLCWCHELSRSGVAMADKARRWSWRAFLRLWVCYLRLGTTSPLSCHFRSGRGESLLASRLQNALQPSPAQTKAGWRNRWQNSLPKATQEVSRRSKSGADIPVFHNNDSSPEPIAQ